MTVDQLVIVVAILASLTVVVPLIFEVDHQIKNWPPRTREAVQWFKMIAIPVYFGWMASHV